LELSLRWIKFELGLVCDGWRRSEIYQECRQQLITLEAMKIKKDGRLRPEYAWSVDHRHPAQIIVGSDRPRGMNVLHRYVSRCQLMKIKVSADLLLGEEE